MAPVLDDLLLPGLTVVFCGTAVGHESAARRAYYANPTNRFWRVLAEVGMTDRVLRPEEYRKLAAYGIGLTDIAKHAQGGDAGLDADDFDAAGLHRRVLEAGPTILAFNGKRAAREHLGRKQVSYGPQVETIGHTGL